MFLGRSDSRSDRRVAGLCAVGIAGGMGYPLTEKVPGGARPPGSLGGSAQRGLRTATRPTLYGYGRGSLLPGRRISMRQNQAFKRRSTREWPHNANRKHHRAKVSAAFVIEAAALSFAGAGNSRRACCVRSESASRHGCMLKLAESRSPPFRVLRCSPRDLFFRGTVTAFGGTVRAPLLSGR